ncbi:MAG: NDP-sugar synthase [Acidobacteriota bacterium]
MVLAAGFGTRLRPLTLSVPKPLLPVAGAAVTAYTLRRLEQAGCEVAAMNLHYLGEAVEEHFGDRFGDLPLVYSQETEILGTLGALSKLHHLWSGADLVVVANGDSLCRWPVQKLVRRHLKSGAAATLLVSNRADTQRYGGGIGIDEEDNVVSFRPGEDRQAANRRAVFAGLHVFSPRLIEDLAQRPADFVKDLYDPLLDQGEKVLAVPTTRDWHDLGTPRRYLDAVLDWVRGRRARRWLPGRRALISDAAQISAEAEVADSAIEAGVRIEAGSSLDGCLVLPGAHIGAGSHLRDVIIGFDTVIAPETFIERRMVTRRTAGYAEAPYASILGDLVYSPLDPPPSA